MTAPSPNSWDEDALADEAEGCATPEIADTGNAMVGCLGWAMIVFIAAMLWIIYAGVRESPPRHPPFSELPDDPAGRGR